ncbi:MAG: hypothetical protein DWI02_07565 [Planctomycetota bacterium]|nr:MAG: hypothetical protein DWI02_07565 [Planctomycetota bacterium]
MPRTDDRGSLEGATGWQLLRSVQFLTGWGKMAEAAVTRWKSGNRADMLRFPLDDKIPGIGSIGDPPLSRVSPC